MSIKGEDYAYGIIECFVIDVTLHILISALNMIYGRSNTFFFFIL